MIEPVIGNELCRAVKNQSAKRVALVGIGLNPPVFTIEVFLKCGNGIDEVLRSKTLGYPLGKSAPYNRCIAHQKSSVTVNI